MTGCAVLLAASAALAQPAFRVKDIRQGTDDANPDYIAQINGVTYFAAYEAATGVELWRTDGTEAGTMLVRDLSFGPHSSNPRHFTAFNGLVFFIAGGSIWMTDGTAAGTRALQDPDPLYYTPFDAKLATAGGTLYFTASYYDDAEEQSYPAVVWMTDGTTAGTVPLPAGIRNDLSFVFAELGGVLYFHAPNGLWRSDGTTAGTWQILYLASVDELTVFNGRLYFRALDLGGYELWTSDGTAAGTFQVKDIRPSGSSHPSNLLVAGGRLFFHADDGTHGDELWTSDGTAAGTVLVRDIHPWGSSSPASFVDGGGVLYFTAEGRSGGRELWRSDGTSAGTYLLKDIRARTGSEPSGLAFVNGALYFSADDGVDGREPWKSDGTRDGTVLLADLLAGSSSEPSRFSTCGTTVCFRANDGVHGYELWRSDGTRLGTTLIRDISATPGHAFPAELASSGGRLLFTADDGVFGRELWISDGAEEGTILVKNIRAGGAPSDPEGLKDVGGVTFFTAMDGPGAREHGRELWKSDGTGSGTVMVKDIRPGPASSNVSQITNLNGVAFFTADDGVHGVELWKSDGTPEGTVLVRDIHAGWPPSSLSELVPFRGALYFAAPGKLWRTDGTENGTVLVWNFSNQTTLTPNTLTVSGHQLYFLYGGGLWRSDGTTAGTWSIVSGNVGVPAYWGAHFPMAGADGTLFYRGRGGTNYGTELWKTDGTPAGTVMVKDIVPGPALQSVYPNNMKMVNGLLYFAHSWPGANTELARSDGTDAGTVLVRDINPSFSIGLPDAHNDASSLFTDMNGTLFFRATDGVRGLEPWMTNGTATGTKILDVDPGPASSSPTSLTPAGPLLFFSATTGDGGTELWATDLVYEDGFESGDLTAWNAVATAGGDLVVSPEAALASTSFGLEARVDDSSGLFVRDDSPNQEARYRARFHLDPNGFDPGEGSGHDQAHVFIAFAEAPLKRLVMVVLQRPAGQYRIEAQVRLDDDSLVSTGSIPISDEAHAIELDWRRAASAEDGDGSFDLWIDGAHVAMLQGLDNGLRSVDNVRLGAMSLKPGASGTIRLDEFASRRVRGFDAP